jgi:hypothetical protein
MAGEFVVDSDKAQQVSQRLTSVGQTIEGFPPGPQPSGPLGSGVLERAWSEFERGFAAEKQKLARSVTGTGEGFAAVASGTNRIDQQKAQEAEAL